MKKSDFFDDSIIAFTGEKHHHAHHEHSPHAHGEGTPESLRFMYYEWSKLENKWLKLRDEDPEPDQAALPNGKFDGQIIEVEL